MVDPETFTTGLQHELNSSPESGLVPFLKRNLSALKHSLISGELSINGIRSPQSKVPKYCPLTKHKVNDRVFVMLIVNGKIWPGCIQKIDNNDLKFRFEVQMYGTPYAKFLVSHGQIFKFNEMNKNIFIGQNEKGSVQAMNEIENHPEILHSVDDPAKKKIKLEVEDYMIDRVRFLEEEINNQKIDLNHQNYKHIQNLKESVSKCTDLLKIVDAKDEKIKTLEDDFEKTVDQNYVQIQNLQELVSKNADLEKILAEKDEKIKTLEDDLEKTVDQNHVQIQNLENSVSKNADLEQILAEKDEKIKTLEETVDRKDMQIQKLEESVTVLVERVGNLKDDLEKTTEQKNIKDKALKESDAKSKKFADIMAAKDKKIQTLEAELEKTIHQNQMQTRNLDESVRKIKDLDQEKTNLQGTVAEKDEKIQTLKADLEKTIDQNQVQIEKLRSQTEKNEQCVEANEKLIKVRTKLNLQMERNELLDKNLNEIMDILNIPGKNRSFAYILPAIKNLKEWVSKSQEKEETEHYTNAQALIISTTSSDSNV